MRFVRILFRVVSLCVATALHVAAQDRGGSVGGLAKSDADGTPIPFALVRLRSVDAQGAAVQQSITNAQGRFVFTAVRAGSYRLELLRIGYRLVTSPPFTVHDGETVQRDLRGSMVGLPLPAVVVHADGACLNGAELDKDPYLSALWSEVQQGVELRRTFEHRYRYSSSLAEAGEVKVPFRPGVRQQRVDTLDNDPDSVGARQERLRARRRADGYGNGNTLQLPDEKELLDDAFLREHCIVSDVREVEGALGLQFRQPETRAEGFGLRGTIWVDASTHLMRRIELEYLNGADAFSEVTLEYGDLVVAGGTLRLPSRGSFTLRPLQAPAGTTAAGTLTFAYWGFREVQPK